MNNLINITEKEMKAMKTAICERIDTLESTIEISNKLSKSRGVSVSTKTLKEELKTLKILNERRFA